MLVQQVTLSYASHANEVIPLTRSHLNLLNTAFNAAPVTFPIVAGILKPTPPSAVTTIAVLYSDGSGSATASVPATAGRQTINFNGTISSGAVATTLANNATAYTATITVDGVVRNLSITGSTAQTYATLVTAMNTSLTGSVAVVSISSGNLVVTSATTGITSTVLVASTGTLLPALAGYVAVGTATAGTALVPAGFSNTVTLLAADSGGTFNTKFADLDGDFYNIMKKGTPAAYLG